MAIVGYETKTIFDAMSRHFDEKNSYDALKYNFKIRLSEATFAKSKTRWQYAALETTLTALSGSRNIKVMAALLVAERNGFKPFLPIFAIRNNPLTGNTGYVDDLMNMCIMNIISPKLLSAFKEIDVVIKSTSSNYQAIKTIESRYGVVITSCYMLLRHNLLDASVLSNIKSKYENVMSVIRYCVDVYSLTHK